MPGILVVVGLGDVKKGLVEAACAQPIAAFGLGLRRGPALAEPNYAFNPERKQHHGAAILRKMLQAAPCPPNGVVLGLGDLDLFQPDAAFVLGDHDRDLSAAVIGLRRILDPRNEERSSRRVAAASTWAVGRALGLSDCDDRRCALSLPETPEGLDGRTGHLCTECQGLLVGASALP